MTLLGKEGQPPCCFRAASSHERNGLTRLGAAFLEELARSVIGEAIRAVVQWSAVSSPSDSTILLGAVAVSNHAVDILPEAIPCVRYCVALVTF